MRSMQVQIVDHQAVAVYSAGGRFTIFRLSDGEPIVDEQLAAERELTDILVLRRAGRYVLIANNAIGRENASRRISQVAGVMGRRIGQAKVYAFDAGGKRRETAACGERSVPAAGPPSAAPCLTFASMVQQYVPNQQNQRRQTCSASTFARARKSKTGPGLPHSTSWAMPRTRPSRSRCSSGP